VKPDPHAFFFAALAHTLERNVRRDLYEAGRARTRTCPVRRISDTISRVKAALVVVGAGALALGVLTACQASVNANAEANVSGEGASADADGSAEIGGQGELSRSATSGSSALVAPGADGNMAQLSSSRVLLGARHDLKLRPGSATANCQCLQVALGPARSLGMAWSGAPPELDDSTQLSIALSSEFVECEGKPKGSLGASYWGYRISGNDVIVVVESARGGRPLTSGAIIPRPVGPGHVFVAPASTKLPYGRPLSGKGLCKIGNPGQVRTAAFGELEVGPDAPAVAPSRKGGDDEPPTIEFPSN
jgi:hypothetical protein